MDRDEQVSILLDLEEYSERGVSRERLLELDNKELAFLLVKAREREAERYRKQILFIGIVMLEQLELAQKGSAIDLLNDHIDL